jgi:hypothetical protein
VYMLIQIINSNKAVKHSLVLVLLAFTKVATTVSVQFAVRSVRTVGVCDKKEFQQTDLRYVNAYILNSIFMA